MKRMRFIAFLMVSIIAFTLIQTAIASPKLIFDDTGFDYQATEIGYLHFTRDPVEDVMTVSLRQDTSPESLAFPIADLVRLNEAELSYEDIYTMLGIDVSNRSLELAFNETHTSYLDLLNYFHDLAPELGFKMEQGLFSGNTYVFACGCQLQENTSLRISFSRIADTTFVRLILQTPFAY